MHFLVITQVFWPDTASTAQHLSDLVEELTSKRHRVTVFTSRSKYENPCELYPSFERKNGTNIHRIRNTAFGKGSVMGRLLDILSFNFLLFLKLVAVSPKTYDGMIGMTSPPMISFLGCLVARIKGIRFIYWTMDLQPELAIASGLIKANSVAAKAFSAMGNYIFKRADSTIALDDFMKAHVIERGADAQKVAVVPVWPVQESVYEGRRMENPFRIENGFEDKIVVMYSGNHSYVHPLDTLLNAILLTRANEQLVFVFIGDGVRKKDVTDFKCRHQLRNILQLPYQPRNRIHLSLGSADVQVVIMGEGQVGYTHPNKVYGAMLAAKPVLYIGPEASHVSAILQECPGNISVKHKAVDELAAKLQGLASSGWESLQAIGKRNRDFALKRFNPALLKDTMANTVIGADQKGHSASTFKELASSRPLQSESV